MKSRLLHLFFLLFFVSSFGQKSYKPETLQFTEGLPSDAVRMTLKKDGFIYVATQRGLSLYDGYVFINSTELASSITNLIVKDDKVYGEEQETGLFEIHNIHDKKRVIAAVNYYDTSPDNDHYRNVYKDDSGNIWCSDFHFIKYFNPEKGATKEYRFEEESNTFNIHISYVETSGELIMASSKGLFVFKKNEKEFAKLNDISFTSALEWNGRILFLSQDGKLFEYQSNSKQLYLLRTLPVKKSFSVVTNTAEKNSLMLYDKESVYQYALEANTLKPVFISEGRINHVFYDNLTHIFWISTQKGLIKLVENNSAIEKVSLPGFTNGPVTNIVEDEKSQIWMVRDSKYIFLEKGENTIRIPLKEQKINRFSFSGGQLLLSTGTGVYKRNDNNALIKIISVDFAVKKAVYYNGKYWLLPEKGPIRVYDSKTMKEIDGYISNDAEYWKINRFNDFEISADNQLWLASWMPKDFGISKFSDPDQKFIEISTIRDNNEKFVADYFHRIAKMKDGNLIFSSTGGFNIVNPDGEIVNSMHSRVNNVVCDNIDGIAEDHNGNIWFGCAEGLYQYNLKTNISTRISKIDGLTSNDLTYGFLLSSKNSLYISNESSLEKINPDEILDTKLVNKLELTSVKVNNVYQFYPSHNITLKEKETLQIELFFSALNFVQKDKVLYRYKFNNDKQWNYLGTEPKLSLIKPNHGKYSITIEAGDNLGNWQEKDLQIKLNIIPPFYKTIWFLIFLFLCFFVGAHFFNVYLVRQEKEKGELKKKIKDNENKMLRSQMNPHFLFNSLNSINSFIIQNKADEAEKYLTAFSRLMRNILENSRKETISLKQELETVKLYLDLEAVRLENKFDYRISIAKSVDTDYVQIPPLILQPFLENAIWHGINYKQDNGFIDIDVECCENDTDSLIIKIKDDGIGRKAASRRKNHEYAYKSYGIDITKERLELQGSYNSIDIKDLYDNFDEPSGTLVTLKIQIKND